MIFLNGIDVSKKAAAIFAKCLPLDSGCTKWLGAIHKNTGYGCVMLLQKSYSAHRLIYELVKGKVPEGKVLDHLCRNRWCVNPSHLEVVTNKENVLRGNGLAAANKRKTECRYGHAFDEINTRIGKDGKRNCKTCDRIRWRKSRLRAAAIAGATKELT